MAESRPDFRKTWRMALMWPQGRDLSMIRVSPFFLVCLSLSRSRRACIFSSGQSVRLASVFFLTFFPSRHAMRSRTVGLALRFGTISTYMGTLYDLYRLIQAKYAHVPWVHELCLKHTFLHTGVITTKKTPPHPGARSEKTPHSGASMSLSLVNLYLHGYSTPRPVVFRYIHQPAVTGEIPAESRDRFACACVVLKAGLSFCKMGEKGC